METKEKIITQKYVEVKEKIVAQSYIGETTILLMLEKEGTNPLYYIHYTKGNIVRKEIFPFPDKNKPLIFVKEKFYKYLVELIRDYYVFSNPEKF